MFCLYAVALMLALAQFPSNYNSSQLTQHSKNYLYKIIVHTKSSTIFASAIHIQWRYINLVFTVFVCVHGIHLIITSECFSDPIGKTIGHVCLIRSTHFSAPFGLSVSLTSKSNRSVFKRNRTSALASFRMRKFTLHKNLHWPISFWVFPYAI